MMKICILGIGIIGLLCAVCVIYDVLTKNERLNNIEKAVWILAAIFFSIITAVIYFLIGKKGPED